MSGWMMLLLFFCCWAPLYLVCASDSPWDRHGMQGTVLVNTTKHPTQLWYVHVPKTGGETFLRTIADHLPVNCSVDADENVCPSKESLWSERLIMLRSPREHVISQYGECKREGSRLAKRKKGAAKELPSDLTPDKMIYPTIQEWLVDNAKKRFTVNGTTFYKLFDARNMQSRYLLCNSPQNSHRYEIHNPHRGSETDESINRPPLEVVLPNLKNSGFMGITELFDESLCLFHFVYTGLFMDGCQCNISSSYGDSGNQESGLHTQKINTGTTLDVLASLDIDTLNIIDMKTQIDQVTFRAAVDIFVLRMRDFEAKVQKKVLCDYRLQQLEDKIHYIPKESIRETIGKYI